MNRYSILLLLSLLIPAFAMAEESAETGDRHRVMSQELAQVGLDPATAEGVSRAMLGAQFSVQATQQIVSEFRLAEQDPQALHAMAEKVHEGIAKHVNAGAISRALSQVRARQAQAQATAGNLAVANRTQLRPVIADAMVSGLEKNDLGQISQRLQSREKNVGKKDKGKLSMQTMLAVRDMVRYGLDSETATAVTTSALAMGYTADGMHTLRQLINNQRMNANMNALGQRMIQGLQEGVQAGEMQGYAQRGKAGNQGGKSGTHGGGAGGSGSGGRGGSGGHGGAGGGRGGGH